LRVGYYDRRDHHHHGIHDYGHGNCTGLDDGDKRVACSRLIHKTVGG